MFTVEVVGQVTGADVVGAEVGAEVVGALVEVVDGWSVTGRGLDETVAWNPLAAISGSVYSWTVRVFPSEWCCGRPETLAE